jgi:hypothetical protein
MVDFAPLTGRAEEALKLAGDIARIYGRNIVDPEHLLLALIRDRECAASRLLLEFNVEQLKVAAHDEFRLLATPGLGAETLRRSPTLDSAIQFAVLMARNLGHRQAHTGHLLVGVIAVRAVSLGKVFANFGLDSAALELVTQRLGIYADPEPDSQLPSTRVRSLGSTRHVRTMRAQPGQGVKAFHICSIGQLAERLHQVSEEVSTAEAAECERVSCGLARFAPREQLNNPQFVAHPDEDVIGRIVDGVGVLYLRVAGHGHSVDSVPLFPGRLVRIPAGVPHDFVAAYDPIDMLFVRIRR